MSAHFCLDAIEDCWNPIDSYGMICVKCNCCGRFDKSTMHEARLDTCIRHLKEDVEKLNHPDFRSNLQQRNIVASLFWDVSRIEEAVNHIDFGEPEYFEVTEPISIEEVDDVH